MSSRNQEIVVQMEKTVLDTKHIYAETVRHFLSPIAPLLGDDAVTAHHGSLAKEHVSDRELR